MACQGTPGWIRFPFPSQAKSLSRGGASIATIITIHWWLLVQERRASNGLQSIWLVPPSRRTLKIQRYRQRKRRRVAPPTPTHALEGSSFPLRCCLTDFPIVASSPLEAVVAMWADVIILIAIIRRQSCGTWSMRWHGGGSGNASARSIPQENTSDSLVRLTTAAAVPFKVKKYPMGQQTKWMLH